MEQGRKKILILGAGGFIGGHLAMDLLNEGHVVIGVDIKKPEFRHIPFDHFYEYDLSIQEQVDDLFEQETINPVSQIDEIYQFAADMGGATYIFTGENDANVMANSCSININLLNAVVKYCVKAHNRKTPKILYSSSACIYPEEPQQDFSVLTDGLRESMAYPANPDSEYGWEKLFSERLYRAHQRNYNIPVHIVRFHNIFGEYGTYKGGKEKAPAAMCRKIAEVENGGTIEVFGDGEQYRSFLYVEQAVKAVKSIMIQDCILPVLNVGNDSAISINGLVKTICKITGKTVNIKHVESNATGVRFRTCNSALFTRHVGFIPDMDIEKGLEKTYNWIEKEIKKS